MCVTLVLESAVPLGKSFSSVVFLFESAVPLVDSLSSVPIPWLASLVLPKIVGFVVGNMQRECVSEKVVESKGMHVKVRPTTTVLGAIVIRIAVNAQRLV